MPWRKWENAAISVLLGPSFALPHAACAQDTRAESIIVTGERQSRPLTETASSVSVTTAQELERQPDLDNLDDVLTNTPNVTLGSGGLGPTIRGQDSTGVLRDLPAFLGGNRPRTTLIVDGRPVSYNEFVFGAQSLWDVDRIEIFRSPQTTTQGRNSISGAIFVEGAKPEFDFAGRFRAIMASRDSVQLSGMVTGPLIEEGLAFRVSGDMHRSDAASQMSGGGQAVDPNEYRYDVLRAKLLATPAFLPSLRLETTFAHQESQAAQINGIREPYEERRDPFALYGVFRANTDSVTLRPQWSPSSDTTLDGVASFGWANVHRFAPPGLGETQLGQDDRTFEAVLRHRLPAVEVLIGASHGSVEFEQSIDVRTVGLGVGEFEDRQDSFGVFGEATLTITDKMKLVVGGRYQTERQRRRGQLDNGMVVKPLDYDGRFSWFLPKFSAIYELSDWLTTGVLVQRAANPGGTTLVADTGAQDIFDAETLWDFEVFLRGDDPARGLHFEANLFHYEMDSAQRSVTRAIETPGGTFYLVEIGNVPRAWSRGAELGLGWRIGKRLDIAGSLGLLETRIAEVLEPTDPLSGKQFQRSPKLSARLDVTWQPTDNLTFNVGYAGRTGYFDDDLNTATRRLPGTSILHLRASWECGSIRIFGFARNVLDRFYLTSRAANGLATAGEARELGVGIETRL